ncbi:peptidase M76 family-domain-containing protein [Apodospora peruviana]|uniref:Mitochondrial inner membrane protease ATP23 n=1 Tax=Apodospora peruviana TaxID=516989 RepID=A0AAE0HV57_9PEZI|nr:peptidase M76 family-domain-containing protein [Apodospora peruviana]
MASSTPQSSSSTPESQPQQPPASNSSTPTLLNQNPSDIPFSLVNDPARTGYDPSLKWWMNYFKILTGKITREGIEHYREDRYRVHEERDCKKCEEYRDWLFEHSPVIRFMREKVYAINGRLDSTNVVCRRCPGRIVGEDGAVVRQSGGFSPDHGILLCANEIRDRGHLEDTLAHEMVHAWDHLRFKVDWAGRMDLRHSACTEVCSHTPLLSPRLLQLGGEGDYADG